MKVLITGATGQLGSDLQKALSGFTVFPLTHSDMDITNIGSVKTSCHLYDPDVIINTAAYVRVDDCEDNPDKAFLVNALGARNVAVVSEELGAKLVHISTDYVFGGIPPSVFASDDKPSHPPFIRSEAISERNIHTGESRYPSPSSVMANNAEQSPSPVNPSELKQSPPSVFASTSDTRSNLKPCGYTEFDTPSPINVYGRSKLAGEDFVRHLCRKHFIFRGSGLFGIAGSSGKGGNFVETMIKLGRERPELRVVNDQVFSPTYTGDMARKIAQLISTDYYGIFHITNSGVCSWYDFASEIIKLARLSAKVVPITSDQYPQKAKRPSYSVLDHFQLRLLGMDDIRSWQKALRDYLQKKGKSRILKSGTPNL